MQTKKTTGMTLIEVILMVLIGAVMLSIIASITLSQDKKIDAIPLDEPMLMIQNALRWYKLDNGFYPSEAQGLSALVSKPTVNPIPLHWIQYLENLPKDSKGQPYHYKHADHTDFFQVFSTN